VIASNRIGVEEDEDFKITFYGSSFIAGPHGNKIQEADRRVKPSLWRNLIWIN
jgi:N-carbamoylputrescine amidase